MSKPYTTNTYPTYKKSGVQWLGDIPSHWDIKPLKYILQFHTGGTPPSKQADFYEGDLDWVTIADLNGKYTNKTRLISQAGVLASRIPLTPKGSLLYSFKLSIGQVAFAHKDLYTSEAIASFLPSKNGNLSYYYYMLPLFLEKNASKNIYGADLLNQDLIKNAKILSIPEREQTAIAEYLDRETAKIDALLQKQAELLAKLSEQRTALITHAVTKGLNPNVAMKNSGVQWLGDIPSHWDIKKLKFSIANISEKIDAKSSELRYFGLENIQSYTGILLGDIELVSEGVAHIFQENDVLFGKLRPYLSKIHLSTQKALVSTEALVWRSGKEVFPKFLFYYSLSPNFIDAVNGTTFGSKMPRASWEDIANFKIPLPNIAEQTAIANYLDTETTKIDALCDKIRELSERLTEYRTTLISDAVTGKIKVIP